MRETLMAIAQHVGCLQSLKEHCNTYSTVQLVRSKFPHDVILAVERSKAAEELWTMDRLLAELDTTIAYYETAQRCCEPQRISANDDENESIGSASALLATKQHSYNKFEPTTKPISKCLFCDKKGHWMAECPTYVTADARRQHLKSACCICLSGWHHAINCPRKAKPCFHCSRTGHHQSLCYTKFGRESANMARDELVPDNEELVLLASNKQVLMQTAQTTTRKTAAGLTRLARLMFDSGSHRSYITKHLADTLRLDIETTEKVNLCTFGTKNSKSTWLPQSTVEIQLANGIYFKIRVSVVENITGTIRQVPLDEAQQLGYPIPGKLADVFPPTSTETTIDLLIGNDFYFELMQPLNIRPANRSKSLFYIETQLGWMISGRTSNACNLDFETNLLSITETPALTTLDSVISTLPLLEKFHELEGIGITDNPHQSDDDVALEFFTETVKFQNNRYAVKWPWRNYPPDLSDNYALALGRFRSMVNNKLAKDSSILKKYSDIIADQYKKGIIEKVDDSMDTSNTVVHYIPHHPVITPQKATTKVRVVYDGSAKSHKDAKSINECLYRGPVLLRDLCGILLRFRFHEVVLIADVEKAFLQLSLQDEDRDCTRFFWLKDPSCAQVEHNIQLYRFCRVLFGFVTSPFLLNAGIAHHCKQNGGTCALQILDNMYVDNFISGVHSVEAAIAFYREAKALFSQMSMNLREWSSNSTEFINAIPEADRAVGSTIKVLGLTWNLVADEILLKPAFQLNVETQKDVLQTIARFFDPLGLLSPVTLKTKHFMQRLSTKPKEWDKKLTPDELSDWAKLWKDYTPDDEILIPRLMSHAGSNGDSQYNLHVFCNASTLGYTAAAYVQTCTPTKICACIVFSKARVSPRKPLTIPRLELLALLLGARISNFMKKELTQQFGKVVIWSDSQCVLSWLSTRKLLPVFIENRLREIRMLTDTNFRYVPTAENPADISSKGLSLPELKERKLWWNGPEWLSTMSWPQEISLDSNALRETGAETSVSDASLPMESTLLSTTVIADIGPLQLSKFSSLKRLLRVVAWCLRFIRRSRKFNRNNNQLVLETIELEEAQLALELLTQRLHFLPVRESIDRNERYPLKDQLNVQLDASDGLLRCHGRLDNSSLSMASRQLILLPRGSNFTKLIIESYHAKVMHSGISQTLSKIRERYWIPQGRSQVAKVLRNCPVCRRYQGGPFRLPAMPPFPKERVTQTPPFSCTGIDFFGPLTVRGDGNTKVWVSLMTCLVVRAVHFELLPDMTTEHLLLALRRFFARYGVPQYILSDNAKQYVLSAKILRSLDVKSFSSTVGVQWHFIPEMAPWAGGMYERLVGVTKQALRKTLGRSLLTFEHLKTLLCETAAVINSRPLTYVYDDIDSEIPLAPASFLSLNPPTICQTKGVQQIDQFVDPDYRTNRDSQKALLQAWQRGEKLLNELWNRWRDEYLQSLRERTDYKHRCPKNANPRSPIVGEVVLIKEATSRGYWKLGKVKQLLPSRDEKTRSAHVQLPNGNTIRRSVMHLYPLEIRNTDPSTDEGTNPESSLSLREPRTAARKAELQIRQQLASEDNSDEIDTA